MAKKIKSIKIKKQEPSKQNWLDIKVFLLLAIVFISVQTIGLYIAKQLFFLGLQQPPFTEDINDITNSIYLISVILLMTGFILLLLKIRKTKKFLWLMEGLAVFSTSLIFFTALFPTNDFLVIIITLSIIVWRYTHRENVLFRDFVSLIAIAGAGAFLGISLGLIPILTFIIILAIYDIIAVFYTKHMVEIGKQSVNNNFAFTVAFPTKKHTFELGNGDLVIPLCVASSILVNGPFNNNGLITGLCLGASFIGLMTSIYTVSVKKIPLPALPPQTILMVIVIISGLLLGL
jgi:presenilin-like A22 family membrane protease